MSSLMSWEDKRDGILTKSLLRVHISVLLYYKGTCTKGDETFIAHKVVPLL